MELVHCSHVSGVHVQALHDDPIQLQPSFLACQGCASVNAAGIPLEVARLGVINRIPERKLADILTNDWCERNPGIGLARVITPSGINTMMLHGRPLGSIYMIREIGGVQIVVFPGSSQNWLERPLHEHDRYIVLGNEDDTAIISEHGSLHDMHKAGLEARPLLISARCALRVQ